MRTTHRHRLFADIGRGSGLRRRLSLEPLESKWLLTTTTSLPNGAELSVSVDEPVTSSEFLVPVGEASVDISVRGSASIGLGEADATLIYVMDVSGSTDIGGGTGCGPILDCEQEFVKSLNQSATADGSVDEVGVVVYADTAAIADMSPDPGEQMLIAPDADSFVDTVVDSTFSDAGGGNGGVAQYTNKTVGQFTNCEAGLQSSLTLVNASSNGTNVVIFLSDGLCNTGGAIADDIQDLSDAGAVIHSIAVGDGSDCDSDPDGLGSLRDMADGTGGQCFEVADPGNLPDIIPSLIGSTLVSLEIEVDGGGKQLIPASDLSLALPAPGAVSVDYDTLVSGLTPGDHEICVTANGSDISGATESVTECETIHVLQLVVTPETETNELGEDNTHTVTATILGDAAYIAANPREIDFSVIAGPNAGTPGTCSVNADCTTDASGQVSFTYTVPIAPSSLGDDTIRVSTTTIGNEDPHETVVEEVFKEWVDTTPPVPSCLESVNPHGETIPPAGSTTLPGPRGGQNEDGYYRLLAVDDVWPDEDLQIFVNGFGPFAVGDVIKYTQADGATPRMKRIGSDDGQAGAVVAHIIGNGDLMIVAIDGSGNESDPIACLVPPPPK